MTLVAAAPLHPLPSQSLAEAARLAEEAREANRGNQTRVFTDADIAQYELGGAIEALNFELTMPAVRRYALARTLVYRTMSKDPALAQRISAGLATSRIVPEFERTYGGEPVVLAAIEADGPGLHDYVSTELAVAMAIVLAQNKMPAEVAGRGKLAANLQLIRRNEQEINGLFRESLLIEQMATRVAPKPKP